MFRKLLQPFYTAYVIITFCVSVLTAFPFIVLISIGNSAASRKAIFTIIRYWAKVWLWAIGMPVKVQGERPGHNRYVIVANHISYLDTIVIFPAVPGYFRPLGKKDISRIPIVGFIYRQIVIMVDRESQQSRARSLRLLWRVLKNEGSIIIFPEGTFNETGQPLKSFYDGAFRLAINTGTAILPIVFPDTTKRWHYSAWWKLWPGSNRAVCLEPVPAEGLTIEQLPELKQRVYELMEQALIKLNGG